MTSPIKPDEVQLRRLVIASGGRIPSARWDTLTRRDWAMLSKWDTKGWWMPGPRLCSGWLTPEGEAALAAWAETVT